MRIAVPLPVVLDRRAETPLQRQIYTAWRTAILGGRFRAGERVPSTRALADAYGIARITVSAAYEQLQAEGYLETRRGSGTFVSSELPDGMLHAHTHHGAARPAAHNIRLSQYGSRLGPIRRLAPAVRPINLSNVTADVGHFPFPLWRRLVSRHLRDASSSTVRAAGQPAGDERLRAVIAAHLSRSRAVRCAPDQVIIVSGSQQALDLCARLLLDPGDEAAMEEPGYPAVRQLFAAHGAAIRSLRVTDEGASPGALTNRTRVVHVTPSHQFPSGVSMSLRTRLALLEWARQHSATVLEDDYDSDFRYDGPPLPALQGLAETANVIYIGTFSNVMFRGLRIGYVVVPRNLVGPFTTAKWVADRHTALLEQAALADFFSEGHFERHVRRMRRLYKARRDRMIDELRRYIGSAAAIRGEAAGMHLTVRFDDAASIRAHADASGVHIAATDIYYRGLSRSDEFILGFSAIGERTIREGIRRIAGASSPSRRSPAAQSLRDTRE